MEQVVFDAHDRIRNFAVLRHAVGVCKRKYNFRLLKKLKIQKIIEIVVEMLYNIPRKPIM